MSSLIVEVCRVEAIEPHPNADRMAIARVKGWRTCILRDPTTNTTQFAAGDKCIYFPPDTVIPTELSDRLGVTKYLQPLSTQPGGRIRVSKLRGEASYGLIIQCENPEWEVGHDVASFYGATKYEPPMKHQAGETESAHLAFHRYFDMENIRNFPDVLEPGEEVVVTEKIHGQNARLGLVREVIDDGRTVWKWMAGSHDVRRKRFTPKGDESVFWRCFNPDIRQLLVEVSNCGFTPDEIDSAPEVKSDRENFDVVLFGERFGVGVQDMQYGRKSGEINFRAFDLTRDAKYFDFDAKCELFARHGIEMVPILFRGSFDFAMMERLAEGPTTLCEPQKAGAFSGREGVVVLSVTERQVDRGARIFHRAQLKCISFGYLARKEGTEDH